MLEAKTSVFTAAFDNIKYYLFQASLQLLIYNDNIAIKYFCMPYCSC